MVRAVLELAPPLIRESLLNDKSFREEYGFKTQAMISFGKSGVTVPRSGFFDAVRTVLAGTTSVELIDAEGRAWRLTIDASGSAPSNLVLSSGQQQLLLPDFSVLSGNPSARLLSLEKSASDVNLPSSAREEWRSILKKRALEDDEVDIFNGDIRDTPVHVEQNIRSEIMSGESSFSSLVPNSSRYFERLVGAYDGSDSVRDYAVGAGREVFRQLTEWRHQEGFLFSLFLSSHSAFTSEINTDHLVQQELETAFDYLEKYGDALSRLGALEVGLRILPDRPELEPYLLGLVHRIRDDDVKGKASDFKLFSALFVLVDGELARTRILN